MSAAENNGLDEIAYAERAFAEKYGLPYSDLSVVLNPTTCLHLTVNFSVYTSQVPSGFLIVKARLVSSFSRAAIRRPFLHRMVLYQPHSTVPMLSLPG